MGFRFSKKIGGARFSISSRGASFSACGVTVSTSRKKRARQGAQAGAGGQSTLHPAFKRDVSSPVKWAAYVALGLFVVACVGSTFLASKRIEEDGYHGQ